MSKFGNAFSNLSSGGGESSGEKIDWKAVNEERVKIFKTEDKPKSRVGIISGIIDLGLQPMDDGHRKSDIPLEEEEAYLLEHPTNYFQDFEDARTKKTERHVFWPQKAQRAVAITVDFPQFEYDWGGEIGKKPFRFLLNGEFITKGSKRNDIILGRTYDLKETTKDFNPRWSLAKNSLLYKMAVATNVIKPDEPFTKSQIGELIGKAALFEVRFWLEGGYTNEKISFKGEVPEEMSAPDYDDSILYYINLDGDNDEAAVKQLRKSVKNTIKRSESYRGSKLQEQYGNVIEGVYPAKTEAAKQEPPVPSAAAPAKQEAPVATDFEDDVPFN